MLVRDYMTRHPITIEPHKRVIDARALMTENKIRHLPVVGDGKRLVGLMSREQLQIAPERLSSLNVWEITRFLASLTVDKVMVKRRDVITASPDMTLEEAASIMSSRKIGSLIVVDDDDAVVGIITETDLLLHLQELLGASDPGLRVTLRIPDRLGEMSRISTLIFEHGWSIMAMGSVRTPKKKGLWDVVIKVQGADQAAFQQALAAMEGVSVVDIRETR